MRQLRDVAGGRKVIGRVDRTELSKNVSVASSPTASCCARRPEWRDRVVHIVDNYPSREDLPEYREYTALVSRIARRSTTSSAPTTGPRCCWTSPTTTRGRSRRCASRDVVFVNSVRDGMNLVVLEGLVLSEQEPAVVLSRETGAAEVLAERRAARQPVRRLGNRRRAVRGADHARR